ncbi:MAG: B12-binding domain-containing radical SAM protein [Candidatus Omnitrophota bacterium]
MKTILVVNPWIYDFAAYDLWMKPWGLLKIISILKSSGHRVFFVDAMDRHHSAMPEKVKDKPDGTGKFFSEEVEKPPLLKDIPRKYKRYGLSPDLFSKALPDEDIDLILVSSGMTYWYPGVFEAVRMLKEKYKSPVVLGGTYATLRYEHALSNSGADYVVKNGELDRISEILGGRCDLSFRNILEAPSDISFYSQNPYAVLRISLGCPFKCSYCAQQFLSPSFMCKSIAGAVSEIRELYEKGIRNFAFYDDALLFDNSYVTEFFNRVIDEGINANFYSPNGLHVRFLNERTAFLLKKLNFIDPMLSLETSDDKKGRIWHDKVTRNEFERAVRNLNRAGYKKGEYTAYLMLGVPGSSFEDIQESVEFVNSLGCKVSLSEFSPVPGTILADKVTLEKTDPQKTDPLLENNTVFSLLSPYRNERAQELKNNTKILNTVLSKQGRFSI